jgi:hypothetical protein
MYVEIIWCFWVLPLLVGHHGEITCQKWGLSMPNLNFMVYFVLSLVFVKEGSTLARITEIGRNPWNIPHMTLEGFNDCVEEYIDKRIEYNISLSSQRNPGNQRNSSIRSCKESSGGLGLGWSGWSREVVLCGSIKTSSFITSYRSLLLSTLLEAIMTDFIGKLIDSYAHALKWVNAR